MVPQVIAAVAGAVVLATLCAVLRAAFDSLSWERDKSELYDMYNYGKEETRDAASARHPGGGAGDDRD